MNARVDVLRVLDEVLSRYEHGETLSPMPSGHRVSEARDAVAELIEAARRIERDAHGVEWDNGQVSYEIADGDMRTLRAALSRIGAD